MPTTFAFSTGLYIPIDLFLRASGLHDKRNNMKEVNQYIRDNYPIFHEGYIWYLFALSAAKECQKEGKFWMYQDDIAERIFNYLDDMVGSGHVRVTYIK